MGEKITKESQDKFLKFFSGQPELVENFYFTGGTALSRYYLNHRFSEDLDFFSKEEFDEKGIYALLYKAKKVLDFEKIDSQKSFNRNIYQLIFKGGDFLKVEFTYYPFPQVEKPKKREGLFVDSLIDISVNKVFTISQNPRGRDFFDLYIILKNKDFNIKDLLKKARIKFDWHIDKLQFASQLIKVEELKDDPLIKNAKETKKDMIDFFINSSQEISREVLKD